MLTDKERLDIRTGRWEIDCPDMCLHSRAEGGASFRGPGTIRVGDDGAITFKLYAKSKDSEEPRVRTFGYTLGTLIPDTSYYDLDALDLTGRSWKAKRLSAHRDENLGISSVVWSGAIPTLTHESDTGHDVERGYLRLDFFSDVEIPCNQRTESQISIAGRKTLRSWSTNAATFTACQHEFLLHKEEGSLSVEVIGAGSTTAPGLDLRVTEALQFVLARPLWWSILERVEGRLNAVEIKRLPVGDTKRLLQRPIASRSIDDDDAVWQLFEAYLAYVLPQAVPKWHPVSGLVHSVIEASAGSLDAVGLALGVSVEGVLRLTFRHLCEPPHEFRDQISKAQDLIRQSPLSEDARNSIGGALGNMMGFRAKRGLDILVLRGALSAEQVAAWNQLRNKSAHADRLDSLDVQQFFDLCLKVMVLFYRLIFTAIRYDGPYTDYGARGWPRARHQQVNIEGPPIPSAQEGPALGDDASPAAKSRYIVRDENILGGEPIVASTRVPVRAIVELWRLGVAPDEVPNHLPHLTLAEVFDALSYYADHQAEIHRYIEQNQVSAAVTHPLARPDA